MAFEHIQDFLSQYRKYVSDKDDERKKICTIIVQITGIQLLENELSVLRGELVITGNSVIKNEIFLCREQILAALIENGITSISGIR